MIKNVIKRDGRVEEFSAEKINSWIQWSEKTVNPKDFNWSTIVLKTISTLPEQVTTKELQEALIRECLNQDTWEGSRMAGRLYASALSKELYETRKHPHIQELHKILYGKNIIIDTSLYYTDEEYDEINKMLLHRKDYTYSHYAINQLVKKYSLKDRVSKITFETPQFIYMRVVMQTFLNYHKPDRLEKIKSLYEDLCYQRINVPTPYFANSLTANPNVASCSVITCGDEAESIGVENTLAYTLTTAGSGVGAHFKTRSLNDPVRNGLVKHAGKIPYFRAFANIMKSSTQGTRSGASTIHFPSFDPEINNLIRLKNPLTPLANRVRESDYSIGLNKEFIKRAILDKPFWLFSYKNNPELYEKFYHADSQKFDSLLQEYSVTDPDKVKEVSASDLLSDVMTNRAETARLYVHLADTINKQTPYKETIYSSNLCIAGNQLVPSDKGLLTAEELNQLNTKLILVDGKTQVKSSPMKLRETSQDVYKITLKNGMSHTVTDYHKIMTDKGLIQCKDLVVGQHKAKINVDEGIFGSRDMIDEAYLLGLWQGDGTLSGEFVHIDIWEDKTECLKDEILEIYSRVRAKYTNNEYDVINQTGKVVGKRQYGPVKFIPCTQVGSKTKWRLSSTILKKYLNFEKNILPRWLREGNKETQLAYVKGLFQTDGTYNYNSNAHYLALVQTSKEYLEELQILLNNLGYCFTLTNHSKGGLKLLPDNERNLKEYECKNSYRLVAGSFHTCLKFEEDTGFITFRGKTLPEPIKQIYKPKEFIDIISIEYAGKEDVYCPTVETDEHLFVSHCFITRNCQEIALPTKPYLTHLDLYSDEPEGVVAFCNLAGLNIPNIKDDEEYERACYNALLMIEHGIENNNLPFPALNANLKDYRSAGVGIVGLAYLMAKKGLSYTTQEGKDFIFEQAERYGYFVTKAATKITEEYGLAKRMDRNKYPEGWLPMDDASPAALALTTKSLQYDWEALRNKIKSLGGLRFTSLMAIAPAESSSIACSLTNSIYPIRSLTLTKTSGDTTNKWVAPEATRLAKKYEIAWDIPNSDHIDVYALFQIFMDQTISSDLYSDRTKEVNISMAQMFKNLAYAAKLGVKTLYYHNSLTDTAESTDFVNCSDKIPEDVIDDIIEDDEEGCGSGGCTL